MRFLPRFTAALATLFAIVGFSAIGIVWLWTPDESVPDWHRPAFFEGTPFPFGTGSIYLEGALSELTIKAAWHGLSFLAVLGFVYSLWGLEAERQIRHCRALSRIHLASLPSCWGSLLVSLCDCRDSDETKDKIGI